MTDTVATIEYTRAVGRRKEASARVRISSADKEMTVNGKPLATYFGYKLYQELITEPLTLVGLAGTFGFSAKVVGGGLAGQAVAVRHGLARALVRLNPEYRKTMKVVGFLTRDSRAKERKKFGLRRARRAPQWSKR